MHPSNKKKLKIKKANFSFYNVLFFFWFTSKIENVPNFFIGF